MSGAGTDPRTGGPAQEWLRGPSGMAPILALLGAVAALGAIRLAWQAGRSEEWLLMGLALASSLALWPLPGLVRELRQPVVFLPALQPGGLLRVVRPGQAPVEVRVRPLLDAGSWLLLRLEPLAGGRATHCCIAAPGGRQEACGTSTHGPGSRLHPDPDAAWAALRRALLAADARRASP